MHRVQTLFVVAILLPLAGVSWLAYEQIETSLEEQAYARLLDATRFQGGLIIDRLVEVADLLEEQQQIRDRGPASQLILQKLLASTSGVVAIAGDGGVSHVAGEVSATDNALLAGASRAEDDRPVLVRAPDSTAVWIVVKSHPGSVQASSGLAARLRPDFLYGNEHEQFLYRRFCVLDGNSPLYCNSEAQHHVADVLNADTTDGHGRLHWNAQDGSSVYAFTRDIFIPSKFAGRPWTIVALEEGATVFEPIRLFQWLFPGLMLFVALSVVLLVVRNTRKRLEPLSELQSTASQLGEGDFSVRIDLSSGDELEALGQSFNSMAAKLGSQFGFLTTMSDIDGILLTQPDAQNVADTIVQQIPDILDVNYLGVLVLDGDGAAGHLSACDTGGGKQTSSQRVVLDAALYAMIDSGQDRIHVVDCARFQSLRAYFPARLEKLRIYPLGLEGALFGALCLDEREVDAFDAGRVGQTGDLIGRLTVAMSLVDRQQKLHFQAHFDEITGLPNRVFYIDRLEQYIRKAARDGERVGVIYADLDRFKFVNDTLGHHVGDKVLEETAGRLRTLIRDSDTVARISGDEFVVAIPGLDDLSDITRVCAGLVDTLSEPFQIHNQEFHLDVSVGISLYPEDGSSAEELLKNADLAMYRAKLHPGSAYELFEPAMNVEMSERYALGQELKKALSLKQLSLVYQPKVDAETHCIRSAEALVRWQHPERGWISPATFIPVAEETGLITQVGEFALQEACRQLALWRDDGLCIQQVAVNLSPHQILYSDIIESVKHNVASAGLEPAMLELEITESLLVEDYAKSESVLAELKALGVHLALDDFGTGYSSLSHLHRLSFDTMKIDRCFIDRLGEDRDAQAIVESILALGTNLGKNIVAEGVETQAQLALLQNSGCDLYQGYYFSKPLAADQMALVLGLQQPLPLEAVNEASGPPENAIAAG
ncbi:MAG: hypothetical protein Hals2KO_22210 [Halioglobus sp.]